MSDHPSCEFCEKKGLPIMPVRFAIAPADARAPRAYGNMLPTGCGDKAIELGETAHYTTRILRSGYLYMYNEALKRWSGWFVTEGAYFMPFEVRQSLSPALLKGREPCSRQGHREIASCITITSPKLASDVWLAFSDVQWTPAVLDKHGDAAYRSRHMRRIDVPKLLQSLPAGEPLKRITTLADSVAEYAASSDRKAFEFSPVAWQARSDRTQSVVDAAEALNPGKGVIVALNDASGMTMELAALMHHRLETFINAEDIKHPLATYGAIEAIEEGVRLQAKEREEDAAEALAGEFVVQPDLGMLFPAYRDRKSAQAERIATVSEAELKRVGDRAWQEYTRKFDEPAMKGWKAAFDAKMQAHDARYIAPLAEAYVSWMKSQVMADTFACHYDDADIDSGVAYAVTLSLCIGGTQDKAVCFDLFTDWLRGEVTDKTNLVLRALVLNQEKTAREIADALKVSVDWRDFPLDDISDAFSQSTRSVLHGLPDVVGRGLIAPLMGAFAKLLGEAHDGKVRSALVAVGLYTQKPFVVVEVTGGKRAFRAMLIRELTRLSGQLPSRRQMQRAVSSELRRMRAEGIALDGTEKKRFLLMVDAEKVKAMPAGLNAPQRAAWMAKSILKPEQVEALQLADWQRRVRNPTAVIKGLLKGDVPYIGALITAALQYVMLQKLIEDNDGAMKHEKSETQMRMRAGVMALGGTIAELTGMGMEKIVRVVPRFARGVTHVLARWLKLLGRLVGIAGGLIMAWWDVSLGRKMSAEGRSGLAFLYFSSAAIGLGIALVLVSTSALASLTCLILAALMIAITVLIEYLKDDKVQDWLERCVWGVGGYEKFASAEESMKQLHKATQE